MTSVLTLEFWQNLAWFNKESFALAVISGFLFAGGYDIYKFVRNLVVKVFKKKDK